jgi:hypothetical protein
MVCRAVQSGDDDESERFLAPEVVDGLQSSGSALQRLRPITEKVILDVKNDQRPHLGASSGRAHREFAGRHVDAR